MSEGLPIVRTVGQLRDFVMHQRAAGKRIGLVPTMGALHHGHLSLVDAVAEKADCVIVSIFVNPTQFGENEDLAAYPRDEQADVAKLSATNTALVYAPTVNEMYPDGDATVVHVGGISSRHEGAHRPGHFEGVATVVTKLLLQCLPDIAIFGEKDFQQLAVIRQFVRDLSVPVEIIGGPIIREPDGLAASSRNVYLTEKERKVAAQFNLILKKLVETVKAGTSIHQAEQSAKNALLQAGFLAVDYVSVVNPVDLEPVTTFEQSARVIAVARIGKVRLLDNMSIEVP